MQQPNDDSEIIFRINVKLGFAFVLLFLAWLIWPDSMLGYGWGFIGVIFCAGAFGQVIEALKDMNGIYQRDKKIAKYLAQGKQVKSSTLASEDFLTEKGVIKNDK